MERIGIIAFTRKGCALAHELADGLRAEYGSASVDACGPARFADELGITPYAGLSEWTESRFAESDALVFVGAAGIAVRAIAPHVRDKFCDPAVVSVDEAGAFAIPLLSGHVGGANGLARAIARLTGGQAAVSTATDVNGLFAVDEWSKRRGLSIVEREIAKDVSASLLEGAPVGFASEFDLGDDAPFDVVNGPCAIGFAVSLDVESQPFPRTLHLVPRIVTVGVGCRRGASPDAVRHAVLRSLREACISPHAVAVLATIDVKRDERAIRELAGQMGWRLRFYSAGELSAVPGEFAVSEFVERAVGVSNVCERAACAEGASLVLGKRACDGVTVAVAARRLAGAPSDWYFGKSRGAVDA